MSKSILHPFRYLLVPALLQAPAAQAGCPTMEKAFQVKMQDYRAYRERNEQRYLSLVSREKDCRATGARISAGIAGSAEARSCTALADASRMNKEMEVVGGGCETKFSELHELQTQLRQRYLQVKDDLDTAVLIMEKSTLMREFCRRELELGSKMVKAFLKLEGDILLVEGRALAGKVDYAKFSQAAKQLKTVTASTNRDCGETPLADGTNAGLRAVKGGYGQGSAAPVPAGVSVKPSSDISGTREAIRSAAVSGAAAARAPASER